MTKSFSWCSDEEHPSSAKEDGSVHDSVDGDTGDATNPEIIFHKEVSVGYGHERGGWHGHRHGCGYRAHGAH